MENNMKLTHDIETKLRNKLDKMTNDRKNITFKKYLMRQLDIFLELRKNNSIDNATIIDDDELDIEYDCMTEEDAKLARSIAANAKTATPAIIFGAPDTMPDEIFHYIISNLADKKEYSRYEVKAELKNDRKQLETIELITIISLFCLSSDPAYLKNDIQYYVIEHPAYARIDFNDPSIKNDIKKFTGVDI